jgi:hypothetical protein
MQSFGNHPTQRSQPIRRFELATYRLASGDVVELVQQRAAPDIPPGVAQVQATRGALAGSGRGAIVVDQLTSARRAWSSVRGGARLTLQTTSDAADLDALGTKLRVD